MKTVEICFVLVRNTSRRRALLCAKDSVPKNKVGSRHKLNRSMQRYRRLLSKHKKALRTSLRGTVKWRTFPVQTAVRFTTLFSCLVFKYREQTERMNPSCGVCSRVVEMRRNTRSYLWPLWQSFQRNLAPFSSWNISSSFIRLLVFLFTHVCESSEQRWQLQAV